MGMVVFNFPKKNVMPVLLAVLDDIADYFDGGKSMSTQDRAFYNHSKFDVDLDTRTDL